MFQKKRGFTLIEVLVAVSIMSLLSVLILVKLDDSRARARDSRRLSDIKQIQVALENYRVNTGVYPEFITPGGSLISGSMTYLDQIPSNPTPMNEGFCPEQNYLYRQQESGASYTLSFCLSDKTLDYSAGYNAAWPSGDITSGSNCVNGCGNNDICRTGVCEACPAGYIAVPGNAALGTKDFCVMKYEARASGGLPISIPNDILWVNVSQVDAVSACSSISGGGYHLISNEEWLTIAANIEKVATNWSSKEVGTGYLNVGWINTGMSAPETNNTCLYLDKDTGECRNNGEFKYKRTHKLSNNQEIWDFGGNVFEFTNNIVPLGSNLYYDYDSEYINWTDINLKDYELGFAGPLDMTAYDSTKNFGQYWAHIVGEEAPFVRGGAFYQPVGTGGGIYNLTILFKFMGGNDNVGFRCVY